MFIFLLAISFFLDHIFLLSDQKSDLAGHVFSKEKNYSIALSNSSIAALRIIGFDGGHGHIFINEEPKCIRLTKFMQLTVA